MSNQIEFPGVSYDKNEKTWQKSAAEISAFILKGLSCQEFFNFICGQEVDDPRVSRWQQHLSDLLAKAQKRAGYQIDNQALLLAARQHLINQINSGELGESGVYNKFCELSSADFKLEA